MVTETLASLLSIGQFAQLSRLSPKALRIYDMQGLLRPAHVDAGSGYRYYSAAQLEQARLIGVLRRLDMPLDQIQALMHAPALDRVALLDRYWHGLRQKMQEQESLVAYLKDAFNHKETQMFEIQERDVPPYQVLGRRGQVHLAELPEFIATTFRHLQAHLAAQDAPFAGAPYTLFHGEVSADSDGPVEVCIPFLGRVTPGEGMTVRWEPAYQEAYATLTAEQQGQVRAILTAHDEVSRWVRQQGKSLARPAREVYLEPVSDQHPALEVAYPY